MRNTNGDPYNRESEITVGGLARCRGIQNIIFYSPVEPFKLE